MDSGAFTELATHGQYRHSVAEYAAEVSRWAGMGRLEWAATQDYMCEPLILARTGLTVREHQRLTVSRFVSLRALLGSIVLPVLQGYEPSEYAQHVRDYGALLGHGAWVGVGSVCKRQGSPSAIRAVLDAILEVRPDLRLHGFGVKTTALREGSILDRLYSADSMAWSYAARHEGRNANSWREAQRFVERILSQGVQGSLF